MREKIGELQPRVPTITVHLPSGLRATVLLDGESVAAGSSVEVNPGEHVVVTGDREYEVDLGEGEAREVKVEAPAPPADTDEPPAVDVDEPSSSNRKRTAGFVSIGIGGAALIGYGAIELALLGDCGADKRCASDPAGKQRGAQALFGLGAVGVGIGTLLILTSKPTEEPERATIIRPLLGRRGGALTIERRF